MFIHIFSTRIKCILTNKNVIFWTLFFPIILSVLFKMCFTNLNKAENFSTIPVAVVENDLQSDGASFKTILDDVSKKGTGTTSAPLLKITYCDSDKADSLLKDGNVSGIIHYNDGPVLTVKASGMDQSILKEFLDQYKQTSAAVGTIVSSNPQAIRKIAADAAKTGNYIKEVSQSHSSPDTTLEYYYALLSMACLFGGLSGVAEVTGIQANQSPLAARLGLAPVHKLKMFLYSIMAATAVQFACTVVTVAFLALLLKIDFGTRLAYILLACLVSCLTGVSFGVFIGTSVKSNFGVKIAIVVSVTLVLSFLSGLMSSDVKYLVESSVPLLAFLNPANAISNTFYSLYYYDTLTSFFKNILLLLGFSAVFYLSSYLVLRRQRYDSI